MLGKTFIFVENFHPVCTNMFNLSFILFGKLVTIHKFLVAYKMKVNIQIISLLARFLDLDANRCLFFHKYRINETEVLSPLVLIGLTTL